LKYFCKEGCLYSEEPDDDLIPVMIGDQMIWVFYKLDAIKLQQMFKEEPLLLEPKELPL
jgi:hypothetical protein